MAQKTTTLITIEVIGPKRSSALSAALVRLQKLAFGLQSVRGVTAVSVSIAQEPTVDLSRSISSVMTPR
jgi:hypothetical protein